MLQRDSISRSFSTRTKPEVEAGQVKTARSALREERGVIRELTPPDGYVGYVGISKDGQAVCFHRIRRELHTVEKEARAVDALWREIDDWESMSGLPAPLSGDLLLRLLP